MLSYVNTFLLPSFFLLCSSQVFHLFQISPMNPLQSYYLTINITELSHFNLLQMRFHQLNILNEEQLPKIQAILLIEWHRLRFHLLVQIVHLNLVLGNSLTKISVFLHGLLFLNRLYQLVQINEELFFSKILEAFDYGNIYIFPYFGFVTSISHLLYV